MELEKSKTNFNIQASFTELFTLMKKYQSATETINFNYTANEMNKMMIHADNAIMDTLHGLQTISEMITSLADHLNKNEITAIGCFFSSTANLVEALYTLRGECEHELFK